MYWFSGSHSAEAPEEPHFAEGMRSYQAAQSIHFDGQDAELAIDL